MKLKNTIQNLLLFKLSRRHTHMNPFEQLPYEMFLEILEYLFYDELVNVRRVDKNFYEMANAVLNERYFIGFPKIIASYNEDSRLDRYTSPQKFLSTWFETAHRIAPNQDIYSEANLRKLSSHLITTVQDLLDDFLKEFKEYLFTLKCARIFVLLRSDKIIGFQNIIPQDLKRYIAELNLEYPNKVSIPIFLKRNLEDEDLENIEKTMIDILDFHHKIDNLPKAIKKIIQNVRTTIMLHPGYTFRTYSAQTAVRFLSQEIQMLDAEIARFAIPPAPRAFQIEARNFLNPEFRNM